MNVVPALVFIAIGLLVAAKPYALTKFMEQVDAIGSKTPADEVEPAEWNVGVTRYLGILAIVVGVLLLLTELT